MSFKAGIYYSLYKFSQTTLIDVVLIHGAGGSYLFWPSNIRRLPECRVFALDLPGHGKSHGHGFQSISEYSLAILEWMEEIKLPSSFICGHSMGGAIALEIALRFPQKVRGLGLISSAGKFRVAPKLLETAIDIPSFNRTVEMIINWSFLPGTPTIKVDFARKQMLNTRPSVLHSDFLACDRYDVINQLGNISIPTVIICGETDRMTPMQQSQLLKNHITGASLVTIPNSGHLVVIEQSHKVGEVITNFIEHLAK